MPWTAKEATSHTKKASTPAKQKRWAKIANAALKEGKGDGYAIKVANSAMDARFWDGISFRAPQFGIYKKTALDKKTKTKDDDDDDLQVCGACGGTGEMDGNECDECDGTGLIDPDEYDPEENPDGIDPDNHPELREDSKRVNDSKNIRMYDTITIDDAAKVRVMENGYVAAFPRIARTGIQLYRGSECGRNDMEVVRVYRPQDQVFHNDAVHSYTHLPLTLDHPPESVTSSNWRKYAVGETGDEVLRDGGAVRVPMMLRDAQAIEAFKSGKNQLSVGYDCDLQWQAGVTDEGEEYDAIQHGIRANHLAVVAAARGGPTLKIGDDKKQTYQYGDTKMNMRTILVDGLEVQVMDASAVVIQRHIQSLENRVRDADEKLSAKEKEEKEKESNLAKKDSEISARDEAIKAKDKTLEAKDGEIAALKKQLDDEKAKSSPAAIDAASRERAAVVVKAQQLMGNGQLKVDGMSVPEIRRAVVDARIGNCKDWSDDRIGGAFDAMQIHERSFDSSPRRGGSVDDAVTVFGKPGAGYQSPAQMRDSAYADYDRDISNAWRNQGRTQQ